MSKTDPKSAAKSSSKAPDRRAGLFDFTTTIDAASSTPVDSASAMSRASITQPTAANTVPGHLDLTAAKSPQAKKNSSPKPGVTKDDGPSGHRERLRARFMSTDNAAMAEYELLEMVLFRVFPRGDTKPLAKALIRHFGSLAEVLNAPAHRLKEVKGVGDRAVEEFALMRTIAVRLVRADAVKKPAFNNWQAVIDYCMTAQSHDDRERFRIVFLDKRNQLIADEVQQTGTVDHTPVYVREILKRALELSATALILVHNHPSGDPEPSRADIDMTKQIVEAAKPLGVVIHDHIIVGRKGHVSLKAQRLM